MDRSVSGVPILIRPPLIRLVSNRLQNITVVHSGFELAAFMERHSIFLRRSTDTRDTLLLCLFEELFNGAPSGTEWPTYRVSKDSKLHHEFLGTFSDKFDSLF